MSTPNPNPLGDDARDAGPYAVFEGERAVRAMNDGDDADDWDTDDGPANDAEALEAEYAAEDAIVARATAAAAKGVARREQGFSYHVHNPFTGKDTWFATFAGALAYASAASAADALDGDLGVWSAAGWGEYRLFRGGRPHAEG